MLSTTLRTPQRAVPLAELAERLGMSVAVARLGDPLPATDLLASTLPGEAPLPELPDFAPSAALLDVAQVSDIIKVVSPDTFERPIYAGNAIQTVQTPGGKTVITVRTAAFKAAEEDGAAAPVEAVSAAAPESADPVAAPQDYVPPPAAPDITVPDAPDVPEPVVEPPPVRHRRWELETGERRTVDFDGQGRVHLTGVDSVDQPREHDPVVR